MLVANLSGVRRHRSTDDDATTSKVGAGRVARLHLDSMDAVTAAAEMARRRGIQALTAAGQALSGWIANVPLARRLAASEVAETRLVRLAGLVLLGDLEHARTMVQRHLRDQWALDHLREGVALVELSWWLGTTVRDAMLARAKGHPARWLRGWRERCGWRGQGVCNLVGELHTLAGMLENARQRGRRG